MTTPFRCPLCREPLLVQGQSLVCANRHTFDIARQGYVNLLLKKPENLYEDKALFAARRMVYEAGFFDGVIHALRAECLPGTLLDTGCGEGTLLHRLSEGRTAIGLDIARPAIAMAAGSYKGPHFCVGDLCNIPLADQAVDILVNVLTPANYTEFVRVLRPGARLLKVIPGKDHLREVRTVVGKAPYAHSADEATAAFARHFAVLQAVEIRYAFPCDEALAAQVFAMTPLTAHEAPQAMRAGDITVDVTLLVGQKDA